MAINVGSLLVSLGLDSAEFKTGLSNSEKEFKKSTKRIEGIGKSLAGVGQKMSIAVTAPLIALGVVSVKAAAESRDAMAQVEASLKSMGGAAGKTKEQLAGMATGLMRKSLYDDDEILRKVTANLLTFGAVQGKVFDRAQQVIVDYAAKSGKDLQATTILVAKALQDPVKGLAALKKVGVDFDNQQIKTIKNLVATGQAAKAQGLILDELGRQTAGSAAAALQAAGPLAQMRKKYDEISETIGAVLLTAIDRIAPYVQRLADAFLSMSPGLQTAIVAGLGLATAFGPLLLVFGNVIKLVAPLIAGIRGIVAVSVAAGVASNSLTVGLVALRAGIVSLMLSLAPWLLALGLIAGAIYLLVTRSAEAAQASAIYRAEEEKLRKIQERRVAITNQLTTATGKARAEAIAHAKALRQEATQALFDAKAMLMLAKATAQTRRFEAEEEARVARNVGGDLTRDEFGGTGIAIQDPTTRKKLLQAEKDLKTAQRHEREAAAEVGRIESIINQPAPAVSNFSPAGEGGKDKKGGGPKGPTGPSAAEVTQRYDDQRAQLAEQTWGSWQQIAKSADERAELELRSVELAHVRAKKEIDADADYSAAQKAQLHQALENATQAQREAIEQQRRVQNEQDANDLAQAQFEQQRDALSLSADMAVTQADRKRIALEILDLEQHERRAALERIASSELVDDAQRKRAQQILAGLGEVEAGERASAGRRNETEVEAYLRNLNKSPEQINEAMDGIKIDGLDALNDGLVQAITGVKSLGAVFKDIANQIISDLLRIAIRKAIIEPLANALFGGSSLFGGAAGSSGGGLKNILGGKRAIGGPVRAGLPYLVGERGPELMVPGGRGTVVSNRNLKGLSGGSTLDIRPSPLFEVYVDGKLVQAAPAMVQGGAQLAQSQAAYRSTRRVA